MKKSLSFIFMALICAIGCQVQELETPEETAIRPESFFAEIEQDTPGTKTYIDEFNNVRFQKGDQVAIFNNATVAQKYQIEDNADGKTSGTFNQVVEPGGSFDIGTETNAIVAYYPYTKLELDATSLNKGNYVLKGIQLPATQQYDLQHIVAQNALPMLSAKTDNDRTITFKNICGIIRFNIRGYGSIRQISFKGINHEKISGPATVSIQPGANPMITMEPSATEEVILDCGTTGVALDKDIARQFMIVLPPMKFTAGFSITIIDTEGNSMSKTATPHDNITYEIKRSRIMDMGEFTFGHETTPEEIVPDNQIWYTTDNQSIIEPRDATAACFGANVTSNFYSNGKGIITFDGPISKIGDDAFKTRTHLVTFSFPSSVKSLGNSVFDGDFRLTSIRLPEGLTTIGNGIFNGCKALKSITIPGTVERIQGFSDCISLESVLLKEGTRQIGKNAFSGCTQLKQINLPKGIDTIEDGAFYNCTSLKEIILPETLIKLGKDIMYYEENGSFENCSSLQKITMSEGLTSIEDYTFQGCSSLSELRLPQGITHIGFCAFKGCALLPNINIPDKVNEIEYGAFSGCSNITTINIPDGITSIQESVFENCTQLNNVHIPQSVTSIGNKAFKNCPCITNLVIPSNLSSIGDEAFYECSQLAGINLPEGLTTIGQLAFYGCKALTQITLPEGITRVEDYLFTGCSNLTSIQIPIGVEYIGKNAFSCCSNLASVSIPDGVSEIGNGTFRDCYKLTSISIPGSLTCVGTGWRGNGESGCFQDCINLETVILHEGTTSIGVWAFHDCTKLKTINFPNGMTRICEEAFAGCTSLTNIELPETIKDLDDGAFYKCTQLKSINIPGSIYDLGRSNLGTYDNGIFEDCSALEDVVLNVGTHGIGQRVFKNCLHLKNLYCKSQSAPSIQSNTLPDPSLIPDIKIYVPVQYLDSYRYNEYWNLYVDKMIEKDFTTNQQ